MVPIRRKLRQVIYKYGKSVKRSGIKWEWSAILDQVANTDKVVFALGKMWPNLNFSWVEPSTLCGDILKFLTSNSGQNESGEIQRGES